MSRKLWVSRAEAFFKFWSNRDPGVLLFFNLFKFCSDPPGTRGFLKKSLPGDASGRQAGSFGLRPDVSDSPAGSIGGGGLKRTIRVRTSQSPVKPTWKYKSFPLEGEGEASAYRPGASPPKGTPTSFSILPYFISYSLLKN